MNHHDVVVVSQPICFGATGSVEATACQRLEQTKDRLRTTVTCHLRDRQRYAEGKDGGVARSSGEGRARLNDRVTKENGRGGKIGTCSTGEL